MLVDDDHHNDDAVAISPPDGLALADHVATDLDAAAVTVTTGTVTTLAVAAPTAVQLVVHTHGE